jgi:hypothetical protein
MKHPRGDMLGEIGAGTGSRLTLIRGAGLLVRDLCESLLALCVHRVCVAARITSNYG